MKVLKRVRTEALDIEEHDSLLAAFILSTQLHQSSTSTMSDESWENPNILVASKNTVPNASLNKRRKIDKP